MNPSQPNFQTIHLQARGKKLSERIDYFSQTIKELQLTYKRSVLTAADREVIVRDPFTGAPKSMLMFASNNYLGLATHPHVMQRVKRAIDDYGSGIGGPPLLNGYLKLIEQTEERLADFKQHEGAMLFSSGFMANLGLVSALAEQNDIIIYDELSHASFLDGIKLTRAKAVNFAHNDVSKLTQLIEYHVAQAKGTVFVCLEGVYSMDGDLAPLDTIAGICKQNGAVLIVDDAHGTGVLGKGGKGTAFHFHCEKDIDITMGTFSKVFATCGSFVTAAKPLIEYLRYSARPYIFSASIPPPVVATVLGGLDVMENEPWLRLQLLDNVEYAISKLRRFNFCAEPQAAIIALSLPTNMDIRKASLLLHEKGMFVNPIEFPAVPAGSQRFRISLMATHRKEDIDKLAATVEEVWDNPYAYSF